jgi:DNA-binding response OmpR family regulator
MPRTVSGAASIRILAVESDLATCWLISKTMAKAGYQLTLTSNGKEGLRLATRLRPDLLILDAALPRMDGVSLVRVLREYPETSLIPAIFLAPRRSVEEHLRQFQLPADDFMSKPLERDELGLRVILALKMRRRTGFSFQAKSSDKDHLSSSRILATFGGILEEIGLSSLLGLMEMERKTGVLVLTFESLKEKARIYFRDGMVVRARSDRTDSAENAELIYDLLSRREGRFDFRPKVVLDQDEIGMPTAGLLIEGTRLLDEDGVRR